MPPAGRRRYNPGEPTLCDLCEVQFSSLKIHKRVFHGDKDEVKCVFCGLPFLWTSALTKHLNVHTDSGDMFCCVCLATFDSVESLSSHLETHSELHAFFCAKCKCTFNSRKGLLSHDCRALTPTCSPLVEVPTAMERAEIVEVLPEPEDVASTRLPEDRISDVTGKSASSQLTPTPKVFVSQLPPIILGRRRCTFSVERCTVDEIKFYHTEKETPSSAKGTPCEVLNPSSFPGDMETAGSGPEMPNSAQIPSIAGEENVPNRICKSVETPKPKSEVVLSKKQDCTPVTPVKTPSLEAQPVHGSTLPKENGFHSSATIENCQANPHNAVVQMCMPNSSGSVDLCSVKIPKVDIPNLKVGSQKVENDHVSEDALSHVKPSFEPSLPVASAGASTRSGANREYLDSQTILHPSSDNACISKDKSEKVISDDITTGDMKRKLCSDSTSVETPLLEDTIVNVVSDNSVVKNDLAQDGGTVETAVLSACVPLVQTQESPELPAGAGAGNVVDADVLPACITRRRHRLHKVTAVCEDSDKNTVIAETIQDLGNSVNVPVSNDEMKEDPGPVSSENPAAVGLRLSEIPEAIAENTNTTEPGLIEENASFSSESNIVSSDALLISQEVTLADAEVSPKYQRRQTRWATTAFGLYHASGKNRGLPKCDKTESEKVSIPKESKEDPISVDNTVSPSVCGSKSVEAVAELTTDAEDALIPKSCPKQEPPEKSLQSQNYESGCGKTSVEALAKAVVLPDRVLRNTRRITTVQTRGSAMNRTFSDRPTEPENSHNGNVSIHVFKEKTDGELPFSVSLKTSTAPPLQENKIVAPAGVRCVDVIKEEAEVVDSKSGVVSSAPPPGQNEEAPKRILRHNSKTAEVKPVGKAPVSSAFSLRVRKTHTVLGMPLAKMDPKISEGYGSSSGSQKGLKTELGNSTSLQNRVALQANGKTIAERVMENTSSATSDLMIEKSKAACDLGSNLPPRQQFLQQLDCKAVKAAADAETLSVITNRRGRKFGRLTTIIIGIPTANQNTKLPDGGKRLNDTRVVSVPHNEIEEPPGATITFGNHVTMVARGNNIGEVVEPTDDATHDRVNKHSEATSYSESSMQSSKPLLQQDKRKAVETTAAAETDPPMLCRHGRKKRRLTTVPRTASNEPSVPKGHNISSEDLANQLNQVGRVADRSSAAPSFSSTKEQTPLVLENGEVLTPPPPVRTSQDEKLPEPFPHSIIGNCTNAAADPNLAADAQPIPKRRGRKTRRLTAVHEEGHEETNGTRLNDTLMDIANKSSRRSMRKRRHSQRAGNVCPFENENISPSSQVVLPGNSDSPVSSKKKRISFNETIECWNPILREMTWRGLCDEIREVPLLKPVPKSKRAKKTNERKKKRRKSSKVGILDKCLQKESEDVVRIDGICVPTSLRAPNNLRPVLKPSPVPVASSANVVEKVETKPQKRRYARRKLVLKNMNLLVEKYGADFSYKGCLKVDGRYHCPDEDCMDNDHRGYSNEKALRNHIKMNHIDVDCPTCNTCGKAFATYSRLNEHKMIHSDDLPFPCKDCDRNFKTAALLKQHAGTHGGFGKCFHCDKTFSSKRRLANHFRDTPYPCECCEIMLWCPTMFAEHEKEIEHEYRCPACPKVYPTRPTYLRHIRYVHYDETTAFDGRYQCGLCKRKFTHWKNTYRHLRRKHASLDFVEPSISVASGST